MAGLALSCSTPLYKLFKDLVRLNGLAPVMLLFPVVLLIPHLFLDTTPTFPSPHSPTFGVTSPVRERARGVPS